MDAIHRNRVFNLVVILLAGLGLFISIELTRIHVLTHTDPEFHAVCAVNEGVNCETVALSPYSVQAGLPVSVWGIFGYTSVAVLAAWGASRRRRHPTWPLGILTVTSVFFTFTSIFLAYISINRIDSLCLFCLASYVVNAALLVTTVWWLYSARIWLLDALLTDLRAIREGPVLPVMGLLAAALILGGMRVFVEPYWGQTGWSDLPSLPSGTGTEGHWIGAAHPKITIVEFSDYECPHCRKAHKKIRMLAAEHPESIRLFHRHLPLDGKCNPRITGEFHPHACEFAKAAECAGAQGRFWEMNDALFSIQDRIKSSAVEVEMLAVQLGIDRSAFKRCMAEEEAMSEVKSDLAAATEAGLRGTPTFLMNGEKYLGRIPEAALPLP